MKSKRLRDVQIKTKQPPCSLLSDIIGIVLYLYIASMGSFFSYIMSFFLIFSLFSPFIMLYVLWMFTWDKNTSEEGGRRSEWVRSWKCWNYVRDYFPIKLIKENGVDLDPIRLFSPWTNNDRSTVFFGYSLLRFSRIISSP